MNDEVGNEVVGPSPAAEERERAEWDPVTPETAEERRIRLEAEVIRGNHGER